MHKALRILTGISDREDFSLLIDSPGWEFISSIPSLSQQERYLALSFAQSASDFDVLRMTAGLSKGKCRHVREVKAFWRRVANKVIRHPVYKAMYKTRLDLEFKRNEQGAFADLASKCWGSASKRDLHLYAKGKLPLDHLRVRAKLYTLEEFLGDLFKHTRDV